MSCRSELKAQTTLYSDYLNSAYFSAAMTANNSTNTEVYTIQHIKSLIMCQSLSIISSIQQFKLLKYQGSFLLCVLFLGF